MKLLIVFFVTVLVAVSSQAQYKNDSTEYVVKIQKYHNMRTTGTILTAAGTGLFVAGLAVMVNSVWAADEEFSNRRCRLSARMRQPWCGHPLVDRGGAQPQKVFGEIKDPLFEF